MFWVECKETFSKSGERFVSPFTPCKEAILKTDTLENSVLVGPFHCSDCARTCVSYGWDETRSFDFNHGTDDARFCAGLGWC